MASDTDVDTIMMRFRGPMTLYRSRRKWLFVSAGFLLFAIGGAWMIKGNDPMGWLVLIFFDIGQAIRSAIAA